MPDITRQKQLGSSMHNITRTTAEVFCKAKKDDEKEQQPTFYGHYETAITCRQIHFYMSNVVVSPEHYIDMIHTVNTATRNDVLIFHINTAGGQLATGIQLINAMRSTEAHVVTVLECQAFSLGTLLLLAGREIRIHDHCRMMFHNFSSGFIGKGNEIQSEVTSATKWFRKIMKDICVPFLSEDELERIVRGEDIWMDSDEIRKRLKKIYTESEAAKKTNTNEEQPTDPASKPKPTSKRATKTAI